jgi:beta-ureidopropionase / N-carbamoyl-L-amino-acid hydrolase
MIQINAQRLQQRLEHLATITDPERPYTRRTFTDRFLEGRAWLKAEFERACLVTHLDAAANLIGRLEGQNTTRSPILIGSHSDTVVAGGRFDGPLGLLAALEVAQTLKENNVLLEHPLEVIDFVSEEPSDYGVSCVGSRAMVGTLSPAMLAQRNSAGETLAAAIARMGGSPEKLTKPLMQVAAFLELHIEQGTRLESANSAIGIVTGFVGIERYKITVHGQTDHAGTTPMKIRKDALVAASSLVQHVHELAKRREDCVATVGQLQVLPGSVNAVPGKVEMMLELRSLSQETMRGLMNKVLERAKQNYPEFHYQTETVSITAPVTVPTAIQTLLGQASKTRGYLSQPLESWAGHDAMHLAKVCPSGMIFIPCKNGRSHTHDEFASPEDCARGANVLLEAVCQLDLTL